MPGRISIARTNRRAASGTGSTKFRNTSSPSAGRVHARSRRQHQIGCAELPAAFEDRRRRRSRRPRLRPRPAPPIAPASSICVLDRAAARPEVAVALDRRPWRHDALPGDLRQSGAPAAARPRTTSAETGPAPPSWWHGAQCVKTIGATSRVNVDGSGTARAASSVVATRRPSRLAPASASSTKTVARRGIGRLVYLRSAISQPTAGVVINEGLGHVERVGDGLAQIESRRARAREPRLGTRSSSRPR